DRLLIEPGWRRDHPAPRIAAPVLVAVIARELLVAPEPIRERGKRCCGHAYGDRGSVSQSTSDGKGPIATPGIGAGGGDHENEPPCPACDRPPEVNRESIQNASLSKGPEPRDVALASGCEMLRSHRGPRHSPVETPIRSSATLRRETSMAFR